MLAAQQKGAESSHRRPERVVASDSRESNGTTLVLRIPRDASFTHTAAAHIIARELTRRLRNPRWSVEYALGSFTATGLWMQQELAKGGIVVTERTAYGYVQDVVRECGLVKVGHLLPELRERGDDWVWGRGANLYSIADLADVILRMGRDMFKRLQLPKRESLPHFPDSLTFTENRHRKRIDGALSWAIRTASPGCRSTTGWRLAAILKKIGVPEHEAQEVVGVFQAHVGDRRYSPADARGDVRRCYRNGRV